MEKGCLHLSCSDFGETYTGGHDWKNYRAKFSVTPMVGEHHGVNVRVQGAIRSYAVGLLPDHRVGILKNENGYRILAETDFDWHCGKEYEITVCVEENHILADIDGEVTLKTQDEKNPYLTGGIGLSVQKGSHMSCRKNHSLVRGGAQRKSFPQNRGEAEGFTYFA